MSEEFGVCRLAWRRVWDNCLSIRSTLRGLDVYTAVARSNGELVLLLLTEPSVLHGSDSDGRILFRRDRPLFSPPPD
jgi:hypothetical protein